MSRDQLFAISAHVEYLVCGGDRFQDLRQEKSVTGGSCVDWLLANAAQHYLTEVFRFGPEVLELLRLESNRGPFIHMVRMASCRPGSHTLIKGFYVQSLQWGALRNGVFWKCKLLFCFICSCLLDVAFRGCSSVLAITLYRRILVALKAFLESAREAFPDQFPVSVTVATPGQASSMTVHATINLAAHGRHRDEKTWWEGHIAQFSRRYVAVSRASRPLYILVEVPPPDVPKPADELRLHVARHYNKEASPLRGWEDMTSLDWHAEILKNVVTRAEIL